MFMKTNESHIPLSPPTPSFCFDRQKRLLTAADYKQVFNQVSFKVHQPNIMCLVKKLETAEKEQTNHIPKSRLGLAISKAKNKHAHERNRIKRLIREYFRLHQHELKQPIEMVFLTKTATHQLSNDDIVAQLDTIWHKTNKKLS